MTKKHYKQFVKLIKAHNLQRNTSFLYDLCDMLHDENPRFNGAQFLKALGIEV